MSNPTKKEKNLWDKMCGLGCIACKKDGNYNPVVSIHHIDGRTKLGAHRRVLPLCANHHQTGGEDAPAIHPWKKQFEKKYGNQYDLLAEVMGEIECK
jgi:hypothetical protein